MLSLTLAKVGTAEEFWQPLLHLIINHLQNTNGIDHLNDLLIVTNLLYMLAAQEEMSTPDQVRSIVHILEQDSKLENLLK